MEGLREAGLAAELRVLPDGEAAKTLAVAEGVYEWLAGLGLTRADTVLGVGGGSLTDLAGFVAATFLRGVEAVYVPTTLVGAVDAAIGGKTGVNLGAKNLVGAFQHPARVVIDADLLDALPLGLRRDGAAEALKAGLIGDPDLVGLYERDGLEADPAEVVRRAVAVKAAVVGRDFREEGERGPPQLRAHRGPRSGGGRRPGARARRGGGDGGRRPGERPGGRLRRGGPPA